MAGKDKKLGSLGEKLRDALKKSGRTAAGEFPSKSVKLYEAKAEQKPTIHQNAALRRNQKRRSVTKPAKPMAGRNTQNRQRQAERSRTNEEAIRRGLHVYGGRSMPTGPQHSSESAVPKLVLPDDPNSIIAGQAFVDSGEHSRELALRHQPLCWKAVPTDVRLSNPKILRLGLDMGTSATKVVVSDPGRDDTAWAVPFFTKSPNPYLLPTAITWVDDRPVIEAESNSLQPFKWHLINGTHTSETLIDAAAFLALTLRHVVAWMHHRHGSYYKPESLVWEVRVGLPAESAENTRLCATYLALLDLAIDIASQQGDIDRRIVRRKVEIAIRDLKQHAPIPVERHFDVSGMLLPAIPTPEIAANIAGFYRSRRWDPRVPYGLLLDVGASTLDCAFCSFLDRDGKVDLNIFTRDIRPLGVFRLHESRVEWLLDRLGEREEVDEAVRERLLDQLTSIAFDRPIPERLDDYVENARIDGEWTDSNFKSQVDDEVRVSNLLKGGRSFFGGMMPLHGVIPVYISGGGVRHTLYSSYLDRISNSKATSWSLRVEPLGIPDFVETHDAPAHARDRLAVAFGLCADEEWYVNYPETIGNFTVTKSSRGVSFISKEQV